jgi:hypothetical protein
MNNITRDGLPGRLRALAEAEPSAASAGSVAREGGATL